MRNFLSKIGSCSRCMRQSFSAALIAGIALAATLGFGASTGAVAIASVAAFLLTILWTIHVGTYARRRSKAEIHPGRRAAMITMARSIAAGAAVSVPVVLWPGQSLAFCGQCSKNSDCGVGFTCRDTCVRGSGRQCPCWECKS